MASFKVKINVNCGSDKQPLVEITTSEKTKVGDGGADAKDFKFLQELFPVSNNYDDLVKMRWSSKKLGTHLEKYSNCDSLVTNTRKHIQVLTERIQGSIWKRKSELFEELLVVKDKIKTTAGSLEPFREWLTLLLRRYNSLIDDAVKCEEEENMVPMLKRDMDDVVEVEEKIKVAG